MIDTTSDDGSWDLHLRQTACMRVTAARAASPSHSSPPRPSSDDFADRDCAAGVGSFLHDEAGIR